MANHKSAVKRAQQNRVRRMRNKSYKTKMKNAINKVRMDIVSKSGDVQNDLNRAVSVIQRSVSKGIIHKNKGSRIISRLTHHVNRSLNA